jgi:putative endonuclease
LVRRDTRTIGFGAERLAFQFLERRGLILVSRNFQCRLGEIDLILRHDDCLVFVEVRYRGKNKISPSKLTVDLRKQRKLIRTAALFLSKRPQYANSVMRFDVVAIDVDAAGEKTIEWIKDAFRPSDSRL